MTWEERRDREERYNTDEAVKLHALGSSRSEMLARYPTTNSFFDGRMLSTSTRPNSGWPETRTYQYDENFFALRREKKSGTTVQFCIVVELPRGGSLSSIPNPTPGIWWDYLFFDKNEKLISVHRRFID